MTLGKTFSTKLKASKTGTLILKFSPEDFTKSNQELTSLVVLIKSVLAREIFSFTLYAFLLKLIETDFNSLKYVSILVGSKFVIITFPASTSFSAFLSKLLIFHFIISSNDELLCIKLIIEFTSSDSKVNLKRESIEDKSSVPICI